MKCHDPTWLGSTHLRLFWTAARLVWGRLPDGLCDFLQAALAIVKLFPRRILYEGILYVTLQTLARSASATRAQHLFDHQAMGPTLGSTPQHNLKNHIYQLSILSIRCVSLIGQMADVMKRTMTKDIFHCVDDCKRWSWAMLTRDSWPVADCRWCTQCSFQHNETHSRSLSCRRSFSLYRVLQDL